MTAPAGHAVRGRRFASGIRQVGVVTAAALVASLAVVAMPGATRASAATGYDQMTGFGPTASAVTVPWTQGLLDNTNAPIASANADRTNQSSPLWFMYQGFQTLTVTVSQTQALGHQSVSVSWNWVPTVLDNAVVGADYLQMMECYGDAASGPTPEQCQYGSTGLLPPGAPAGIGGRFGDLCTSSTPSTSNPPGSKDGTGPAAGCDPAEPSDPSHLAPCPGTYCNPDTFDIPFAPVSDPNNLDYAEGDTTYYSAANTDEVQEAVANSSGTGQQQFQTLTGVQAPGLGCGQTEAGSSPRGCWLVIVPRGQYEPNGYDKVNTTTGVNGTIQSSPLSATNWAQRIQVHLSFAPVGPICPPGTPETQTVGTQLVARAMQSWQQALNQSANCTKAYGYSAVLEATSTQDLSTPGSGVGLAFTTIPIGSEATRHGGSPPANLPPILYAPVAVAALDFGFNIDIGIGTTTGRVTTPVKLTPLLAAKAVTQSYLDDLPDYYPAGGQNAGGGLRFPGPSWAQGNPVNISGDPTFEALNPSVPATSSGPLAPLLTFDHSALNQQIWNWIQSGSAATTWLGGTADASDGNMKVDPAYQALNLGTMSTTDSFPRAYGTCLDLGPSPGPSPKEETKCSLDLLPYIVNYDSAAAAVLRANNPDENGPWDPQAVAPDGTLGWWDKVGVEPLGQTWMWAADDTPDLAAYGLVPAQLCNDAGTTCISPSTASVTAAVNSATLHSSGLLQVNPANPGTGGYPLTQIIYAAVPTNQSAAALNDYANLISYAAGTGQTTGSAAGDLPPGYLPLSESLQQQAMNVVAELRGASTTSGSEPLTVTIPSTGAFALTVGTGTVTLTASGASATGVLIPIAVSDTRNTYPGWSVSGQASGFTGTGTAAGSTIPGNQLGWTPTDTSLAVGAETGGPVAPGNPGLGSTAAVLAQAPAGGGFGTSVLRANLTLAIPALAAAGPYAGTLTLTAVTALP